LETGGLLSHDDKGICADRQQGNGSGFIEVGDTASLGTVDCRAATPGVGVPVFEDSATPAALDVNRHPDGVMNEGRRYASSHGGKPGEVQTRSKFGRSGFSWDPFFYPTPLLQLEPPPGVFYPQPSFATRTTPRGTPRSEGVDDLRSRFGFACAGAWLSNALRLINAATAIDDLRRVAGVSRHDDCMRWRRVLPRYLLTQC